MKKRVYYGRHVKHAMNNLRFIHERAERLCKYEMTEGVQFEMNQVLELSNISEDEFKGKLKGSEAKETFRILLDRMNRIEDCLGEVHLLTGDIIKNANNLSEEQKAQFYYFMGIAPIKKEDQGISHERSVLLHIMLGLTLAITDKAYRIMEDEEKE